LWRKSNVNNNSNNTFIYPFEVKVKRCKSQSALIMSRGRRGEFTGGWVARLRQINKQTRYQTLANISDFLLLNKLK